MITPRPATPTLPQAFATALGRPSFESVLLEFCTAARLEGRFFLCQQESLFLMARLLDKVDGLSLKDRYDFCMAPVNLRDPVAVGEVLGHARRYAAGKRVPLDVQLPSQSPTNHHELRVWETAHQVGCGR